jgi:asparagine synthase (glutamine-hydrolysing)
VSEVFGTQHREIFVQASDQIAGIPTLVRALDEPSDPIAACMFEVARFASRDVKVVLGGDGGDEIFAGFDRYSAFPWVDRYAALPAWFRRGVVHSLVGRLPESFAYKSWTQRVRWLDQVSEPGSPGRRYARMTSFFRFGPGEREWLYGRRLGEVGRNSDAEAAIAEPFERLGGLDTLHRMLSVDSVTRLPEHTLMLTDRLGMASGLETRAPLLDHELAEFCARMPAGLKIKRGRTKHAMREASRRWLPDDIVSRPKQGFMFPVASWLSGDRLLDLRDQLLRGPLVSGDWIRASAIERLISEHEHRRTDHHVRIWMLLNLDTWLRIYVEGSSESAVAANMQPSEGRG